MKQLAANPAGEIDYSLFSVHSESINFHKEVMTELWSNANLGGSLIKPTSPGVELDNKTKQHIFEMKLDFKKGGGYFNLQFYDKLNAHHHFYLVNRLDAPQSEL